MKNPGIKEFLTEPIRLFLDMCLWEKGIKEIDEITRQEMIEELAEDLYEYILQATFTNLDPKYLEEWKALNESGEVNSKKIMDFFRAKISNFDQVVDNTMREFKNIYVSA